MGLKITVKDTGMRKSMYRFLEDAKKSTGGGFSILGFRMLSPDSSVLICKSSD